MTPAAAREHVSRSLDAPEDGPGRPGESERTGFSSE